MSTTPKYNELNNWNKQRPQERGGGQYIVDPRTCDHRCSVGGRRYW